MHSPRRRVSTLLLALACCAAAGCAAKQKLSAADTYAQAAGHFDEEAYELAIQDYKELLDQHPFSEHAEEAELKIAHAYYLMRRYAEAIAAFSDFERMHPTSPNLAFVAYHLGMSYLEQTSTTDRDQSPSSNAHAYFRAVVDRYPGNPWAERAQLRLRECQEALAGHELYVAAFYLRQRNLRAAEARLAQILRDYPGTEAAARALYLFGEAYAKEALWEPATLALRALVIHYPEDPHAAEATDTLAGLDRVPDPVDGDPLAALVSRLGAANGTGTAAAAAPAEADRALRPAADGGRADGAPAPGEGLPVPPY
jgi:outer membrane protein assembly factor BamD